VFLFALVFLLGTSSPGISAEDTCLDCHKDIKFLVQNKKLYDYYKLWEDSTHDLSDVTCTDCHGGSSDKMDKDAAHKGKFLTFKNGDKTAFKQIPLVCGRCHKDVLKNFISSKHYKELRGKGTGPNCVTCHGSMNTGVYEAHNIAKGCEACHNEESKNSPEVGAQAKTILKHINFTRSYKKFVTIYYSEKEPELIKKINSQYTDIVYSWHTFDFKMIDEKSMELLNVLKAKVNKKLAERKKSRTKE
jgi:hypothetical protein